LTETIDHQVKFLKDGDAEKQVLSEHHSRRFCLASEHFYRKHFSHIDCLNTPIGVLRIRTPQTYEP